MDADATPADLERLYREHFRVFVRAMTAQLGDADSARDVVQEAFSTALRRLDTYRGEGALEAWVWRIVVNKALDAGRKRTTQPQAGLIQRDEPREQNGNVEERRVFRARLAALPERQRLAMFLRYYADLDYATIAGILEVSPGTVAATLHAARATLRDRMEEMRP